MSHSPDKTRFSEEFRSWFVCQNELVSVCRLGAEQPQPPDDQANAMSADTRLLHPGRPIEGRVGYLEMDTFLRARQRIDVVSKGLQRIVVDALH